MKGHDVGATVAFADYTRDVDALRKQLADAQATVEALQRERDEYARMWRDGCIDRGEAYKVIVELTAALDAERAEIAKVRATCDMLGKERNEADEAKYHAELKLTQLQALVRGKEVTDGETE